MKKILLLTVSIVLIILIFFIFNSSGKNARIKLLIVPTQATILINGNSFSNGVINLKPGKYTLKASYSGFKSEQESFVLKPKQSLIVGLVLLPNSPKTANFYKLHPNQEQLSEAVADNLTNQFSQQSTNNEPIIKFLPHNGPNYSYSINYANNPNNPTKPFIQITANNQLSIDAAIEWIRSLGYQISNLNLQFINQAPVIKL